MHIHAERAMRSRAKKSVCVRMMMLSALLVLLPATQLTACGQTGALYFDEDPPADQLPPSKKSAPANSAPQPADEKKDQPL